MELTGLIPIAIGAGFGLWARRNMEPAQRRRYGVILMAIGVVILLLALVAVKLSD